MPSILPIFSLRSFEAERKVNCGRVGLNIDLDNNCLYPEHLFLLNINSFEGRKMRILKSHHGLQAYPERNSTLHVDCAA